MTDEQRLERERGNIRDGYASLHSAQLGAQFLLAQLDTARQQRKILVRAIDPMSETAAVERNTESLVAYLESLHKEVSEERRLKREVTDKYADYCIARNEHVVLLKAAEQREAQLREALIKAEKDSRRLSGLEGLGSVEIQCEFPGDRYSIGDQIDKEDFDDLRSAIDAALATKEQNG